MLILLSVLAMKGVRTVNEMTKRINELLSAKIDSEYYAFLDELEKKEAKEIIAASYEKVFKEDIMMILSENDLPYDRAKALLRMDYPLDAAYKAWLGRDSTYMEDLRDSVEEFAKDEAMRRKKEAKER